MLKLGLLPDRDALYERLDRRCARMFEAGLVEEVRAYSGARLPADRETVRVHGYKQALQFIEGELSPRDAIFYAQRNTRQYAKRQITWFRREPGLVWLKGFGEEAGTREEAVRKVREFLAG